MDIDISQGRRRRLGRRAGVSSQYTDVRIAAVKARCKAMAVEPHWHLRAGKALSAQLV
jgi:hypothetical protein